MDNEINNETNIVSLDNKLSHNIWNTVPVFETPWWQKNF